MLDKDDDLQIVETFARFGRAIYMANVVELGLAQTLVQIEFLTPAREKHIKEQRKDFDRNKFDAEFETFMAERAKQTMGTLNLRVSQKSEFDEALKKRISDATLRRNFLAHRYWPEMSVKFMTKEGRDEMIKELSQDADIFEQLDRDIRQATRPVREKLGINEAPLNEGVEKRLGELKEQLKLE